MSEHDESRGPEPDPIGKTASPGTPPTERREDNPEAPVPGGSSQGAALRPEDEPEFAGLGLEGATASDNEPPSGASPPH